MLINFNISYSQMFTNSTVQEMKLNMSKNWKDYYLAINKKVLMGKDSMNLFEYRSYSNSSFMVYWSFLGRIVMYSKRQNISLMPVDIGNCDMLFKRIYPPKNDFIVSWDATIDKSCTIGIYISSDPKEYIFTEVLNY